jgi:hypothetical protein
MPDDTAAAATMASALRAVGKYEEALLLFERVGAHERRDEVAPGRPGRLIDIACLHWLLHDYSKAIGLMHGLAAGILDGSIKYGDAAGGMSQGLLLYYMAISNDISEEESFALDYLRNRVKRSFSNIWPCPVAQYYLGDVTFEFVMEAVNRQPVSPLLDKAKAELGRRRDLSVALFHDGVKSRVQGDEEHCLARMRECYGLENPLMEQEWYLARYEVQKVANQVRASK